jgi:carboxylesterase
VRSTDPQARGAGAQRGEAERGRTAARIPDPEPFDLPGGGGAAALCLHGLTGTPYEVRPLAEALAAVGVRAVGPVLPGHNATPEALARVPCEAWIEAARDGVRALRDRHDTVFGVGLSMGGLLTLLLAAEARVDAAVVVGVPLRLRPPFGLLVPLLRRLVAFPRKRGGSDIRDPAARARHPSYDVLPLAAVAQLQQLQRRVRGDLGQIACPLMVAHGAHDTSADPADSRRIFDSVRSRERRHLLLADSGHVVPVDHDGPRLAEEVARFLAARIPSEA